MTNLIYAGVGPPQTPLMIKTFMTKIAYQMSQSGWHLRSGFADGADKAFGLGAAQHADECNQDHWEMHLPWQSYNQAPENDPRFLVCSPNFELYHIAKDHHQNWNNLSGAVKLLMMRNVTIALGIDLKTPATCLISWTPDVLSSDGTDHTMRVAAAYEIPVFDLASKYDQQAVCEFIAAAELNAVFSRVA